ncbi:MAG TPA: S9 family peptidase [Terriglobales bacterium]|jgi:dipeptidyl aminopeptidase/acylaminoacyl peptidase
MFKQLSLTTAALVISLAAAAGAQSKPVTPQQLLNLHQISDLRFSPDGARLAFVVSEPVKGTDHPRHIWLMDVASRRVRQFTYSAKSDDSPRWSPDGRYLAFLSNRDEGRQIYIMPMDGGDAYPITEGKRSVGGFEWSPDGGQIAFTAPDEPTADAEKKQKDKDDALVVDHEGRNARLWLLPFTPASTAADSKKAHALTSSDWSIREAEWVPHSDRLIVAATNHPDSDDNTERLFAVAANGAMTLLYAPKGTFGAFQISRDGTQIAYTGGEGPNPHDVMVRALDVPPGSASRDLTASGLDRAMSGLEWRPDGTLLADAEDGFETRLYSITAAGAATPVDEAAPNPRSVALARDGMLAFVGGTATRPPEIYLAPAHGTAQAATHFNASWSEYALAAPSRFHFKSFDGMAIEGALLKPVAATGAGPWPTVILVHGGPTGAWSDSIESWGQLLAAHGFAAAYFNIRGSTGYGEKFLESNRADWGGADYKDVMAGVDYLVKQGIADPERLGIGGWSYGGYMSEWAITQTNRFKAAVSGAGMVDLMAEFETENGPSYDRWFWGLPYDKSDGFIQHSPLTYLKNAHTPILILQGINDTTDPLGQSTGLYRGLKYYGAPAELVEYPRENHGFQEEQHQIDRLNRILAWYQKYLQSSPATP